jgi:hypothetical protein
MMNTATNELCGSIQSASAPDGLAHADGLERFYDNHPYPPPVKTLDGTRKAWADG